MRGAEVAGVVSGSIAEELGLRAGDRLLRINGTEILDYFDYKFLSSEPELLLSVRKADGSEIEFEIENEAEEELGLLFENMLFGNARSCRNKCLFCFIDQLPQGMRPSLYFKDDDSRLSFLYGNYVTMTNMTENEVDKLIRYRISPVNISVHTTNPELRQKMLRNKNAGEVIKHIRKLYNNNIRMNMQIVLCRGLNDGAELDRTLRDLSDFAPAVQSISVVPVGLTRFRQGLYPLEPFGKAECEQVIRQVGAWQETLQKQLGTRLVYLADEFYLTAERDVPPAEEYEGFPQIENGVGMLASMKEEFLDAIQQRMGKYAGGKTVIATGELSCYFIQSLVEQICSKWPDANIKVISIKNHFFGGGVSVSGLLCGKDLIEQLSGIPMDRLLVTCSMLKADEDIFLDDITVPELEAALKTRLVSVQNNGFDFLEKALGGELSESR